MTHVLLSAAVKCDPFKEEANLLNAPTWTPTGSVGYGEKVTLMCTVEGLDPTHFNRTQTCLYDGESKEYRLLGDPQDCGGGLNIACSRHSRVPFN